MFICTILMKIKRLEQQQSVFKEKKGEEEKFKSEKRWNNEWVSGREWKVARRNCEKEKEREEIY